MRLADGLFIDRAENILITGATGCGKSYLACALGRQACSLGYRVIYFGMNRFLERIAQSKLDGTFIKMLNQIEKTHLLILDDFGLTPFDSISRLALLQVLEDRYERRSVIITSQLPVMKWYDFIGEPTLADAIMDRLAGNAHRIELKGESLRKKKPEKKE
jgi:DNA replication protein DnaC